MGQAAVHEAALSPLGAEQTAELVRAIAPQVDIVRVVADSEGNPLFALGLARMPAESLYSKLALLIGFAFVRLTVTFRTHDYTGDSGTRRQGA